MIKPESFFFAHHLCQRCLIFAQVSLRLGLQRLLLCLYVYLDFSSIIVLHALLSNDLAGTFMPEILCLELLALEIEESKRVFLPGFCGNVEPTRDANVNQSKRKSLSIEKCTANNKDTEALLTRACLLKSLARPSSTYPSMCCWPSSSVAMEIS